MTASVTGVTGGAAGIVPRIRDRMAVPFGTRTDTPVSFSGTRRAFASLLARGVLLQLLTFGFYRFWLLTDIRRHLWSNTRVGGESFEYTGTAKELVIGFLIALAILVPIYVLYFIAGTIAEQLQAFASVPLFLVLYALTYYAAYRARRYRATRTLFRGLRLWMTGSGWGYLGRAIMWDGLTVLTLGLAYPWRKAALERYLMRNTHYGTLQGDFTGTGWQLFKKLAPLWGVVAIIAIFAFVYASGSGSGARFTRPDPFMQAMRMISLTVGSGLALGFVFVLSIAITMRWRLNAITVGEVTLESRLPTTAVLRCGFMFVLALVALGIVVGTISALAATSGIVSPATLQNPSPLAIVGLGVFYIAILLTFGAIKTFFIERGLWRAAAATLVVHNLDSIESARAAGQPDSALGQGLADALDMGF